MVVVSVNMPNEMRSQLKHLAIDQGRTLSNLITHVLTKYLEEVNGKHRLLGGD